LHTSARVLKLGILLSKISIWKMSMPLLPTSSHGGYEEEKPVRGHAFGANVGVYSAVVVTSLVWLGFLLVAGGRDWAIF
jgi:hypothetical protein